MAIKDIDIIQGSTFEWLQLINDVNGVPLDMTAYTGGTAGARGKIRKKYADIAELATFSITVLNRSGVLAAVADGTCHLTTEQTAALVAGTFGKCYLLVRLTATETAALPKGSAVYDIEIEDLTGFVFKPFTGSATISPESTK